MLQIKNKQLTPDGPIPGENFTSDTRNYPWHRPPEITDMDTGIEKIMKKLSDTTTLNSLLTVLQTGVPVVTAADIFLTNAIGSGKITPDMAMLLAGPTTHIMKMLAEDYGIEYDMGLDDEHQPTIAFLKAKAELDPKKLVNVADNIQAQVDSYKPEMEQRAMKTKQQGGFAGMPSPDGEGAAHEAMPGDAQEDTNEGVPS